MDKKIKKCKFCSGNFLFDKSYPAKIYCSKSCRVKKNKKKYRQSLNGKEKEKEYMKLWEEKNIEKRKEYHEKNEERRKKYFKDYYQTPEVKERMKKYYQRLEVKKRFKEYQQQPGVKIRIKKYQKEYHKRPKVKVIQKEYFKKYYKDNKKKKIIYAKKYGKKNKDKINKKSKKYYKDNNERIKGKSKIFYEKNKNSIKIKMKKYRKKTKTKNRRNKNTKLRRKIDKEFALKSRLRSRVRSIFKRYIKTGKIISSKEYGIDYKKIIEYLKPFPKDISKYHIDHIIPLCSFKFINKDGTTNFEEIKKAFIPENHQWLLIKDNLSKGRKIILKSTKLNI